MKQLKYFFIAFLAISVVFVSCKKDEDDTPSSSGNNLPNKGVLVLNEGQLSANNASISYHEEQNSTTDMIFQSINDRILGDVLQSVLETDNYYFLVVNNSGKIEVVNKSNFKHVKTIEGFQSPRYMVDLGNGKALVSNATFATGDIDMNLDIINLSTLEKEGAITVNNWCEQMVLKNGTVYIANTGKNQLLLVDPVSLSVKETYSCNAQPSQIVEDATGNLWIMCLGNFVDESASLMKFNPSTNSFDETIDLGAIYPQRLSINKSGSQLYLLADKLYSMNLNNTPLSFEVIIEGSEVTSPYGLGIDPVSGQIFIGDAKDFASNGKVFVFNELGESLYSFDAGVSPNSFIFR